jgi:uncharacterized protein YjbI with pentapeptide repeats
MRILRGRDLNCGDFSDYADLRRIDLSGAHLRSAEFRDAKLEGISFTGALLQGAFLDGAELQGASLDAAELQDASLHNARLQGASLDYAKLQGASLDRAQLQGASLIRAQLQGASLDRAQLQGASLDFARLQGASLVSARLQGASLTDAQIQGAFLNNAQLQGASLNGAKLQGASLSSAKLQGVMLDNASLGNAILSGVSIWGAREALCVNARITDLIYEAVIDVGEARRNEQNPASPDEIEKLISEWVAQIPGEKKEAVRKKLRQRLTPAKDDTELAEAWRRCEDESRKISQEEFDGRYVTVLRAEVCDAENNGAAIGSVVARNLISKNKARHEFNSNLAHALLGEDGKPCTAAKDYDQDTKTILREAASPPPAKAAPK